MPLPKEKHDEVLKTASNQAHQEEPDSDTELDSLEFPEVPKVLLRQGENTASAPTTIPPLPVPHPVIDHDSLEHSGSFGKSSDERHFEPEKVMDETLTSNKDEQPHASFGGLEDKQFLPFISPPSLSSASFSVRQSSNTPTPLSRTKSEANVDLQDVLAAAQAAAETAERAAAAARSAASLAQVRINELTKKNNDQVPENSSENPFYTGGRNQSVTVEKPHFDRCNSIGDPDGVTSSPELQVHGSVSPLEASNLPSVDSPKANFDAALPVPRSDPARHQPQRLSSMDDESFFSYPNLFRSQSSNLGSHAQSLTDNSRSSDGQ